MIYTHISIYRQFYFIVPLSRLTTPPLRAEHFYLRTLVSTGGAMLRAPGRAVAFVCHALRGFSSCVVFISRDGGYF